MENLQTFKEVCALKKLREEYEQQLKAFGVELCDLPDECTTKLNECIQLKRATKLHDLGMNFLQEFYFTRKKEHIDHHINMAKIETDIRELEEQIAAETIEFEQLQSFIKTVKNRLMSESDMEKSKLAIEKKINDLIERQKSFTIPEDANIDELISKIELLESRKKNSKPN